MSALPAPNESPNGAMPISSWWISSQDWHRVRRWISLQSAPIVNFDTSIIGTEGYGETGNSDVVIITSGFSRKPGMTRDELLLANMKIVAEVTSNVVKYSPECIIIMVANPVDAMTYLAIKISKFPRNRVLGLSGVLDAARLSSFIAAELKVSPASVSACVLGEHGKNMLVIPRLTTVKGKPITKLLPAGND